MATAEIEALVQRLNGAWTTGRTDELLDLFDPNVVLLRPPSGPRIVGREAVVRSYEEFTDQAVLHGFEAAPAEVDEFGTTAIASCPYTIDYEIGGRRWRGSGRDVLVLRRTEDGWKVVWRTVLPGTEVEVGGAGS